MKQDDMIKESSAEIIAESPKTVSKQMEVFYNPVMKLNRSLSVCVINAYFGKPARIADPMAGTGIRAIRLLKEAEGKIESIDINDYSEKSVELIKKNLELNKINNKFTIHNKDANLFLLESTGFDYIDIDPFGTPNPFLDSAIKRIARDGILAVTATDTAALTGTYEHACERKYWAKPLRNYLMHEIGLRILIRKIQLIGAQYEKALVPVLSYSKDHYYRIFFRCEKGKKKCDIIVKQHKFFQEKYGPIWTGKLEDSALIQKMLNYADPESAKLLEILRDELDVVGFKELNNQKMEDAIKKLKSKGIESSRTHFAGNGIKCDCDSATLFKIIKS